MRKDLDENTKGRYGILLKDNTWFAPNTSPQKTADYILEFERFMRDSTALGENIKLSDNARIRELLEMLRLHGDSVG
jgi:hypothetical protein